MKVFPKDFSHFIKNCPQRKRGPLRITGTPRTNPGPSPHGSAAAPASALFPVLDGFDELISKLRILPQETWDGTSGPEIAGWEDFGRWGGPFSGWVCVSVSSFVFVFWMSMQKCMSIKCVLVILENMPTLPIHAYTMHRQKYQFRHKFGLQVYILNQLMSQYTICSLKS